MFNGSHSRTSHPFDKRIPKMPRSKKIVTDNGITYYEGYESNQRQIKKKMHKKKQRQYDTYLERKEWEDVC